MIVPSVWPDWLNEVWAKSPPENKNVGETLAEHTWTLLCRVRDLARLRPGLPAFLNVPRLWHLLFWAAFLHDWGKSARGFQAALRGGPRWGHRHEVLSLVFLDWVASAFEEGELEWVAAAIATHHKDISELRILYPTGLDPEDDPLAELVQELDEETAGGLWQWLHELPASYIHELGLDDVGVKMPTIPQKAEALLQFSDHAVQSIQRWLRRCYRLVRDMAMNDQSSLRLCTLLLRGYLIQSDYTASAHVKALHPPDLQREAILRVSGLASGRLYAHQEKAAQTSGSALLIAPTGSGKTESALLWAAHQAETKGIIPRLVYALPFQASMNAMYDRLQVIFPEQVGLFHGRGTLALYRRFMDQEYTPQEAARLARSLQSGAAFHALPVHVSSPYQMLKAVYQLKGYEAMLADYAQAAFIFDEIHAYEPSRLAMILETVRYLREKLNASFFFMSATLPSAVHGHIEEVLGEPEVLRASPDLFRSFTRHRVQIVSGDLLSEPGLGAAAQAFQEGQSVLVTCNTVARAQQAYQALKSRPVDATQAIVLIHGGFNGRDRLRKEQAVLASAGLGSGRKQPVMVVSTQVVEVSLNLDLDTIFSDPAPLEALIQRFGRVNRKRRLSLAPVHVFTEPSDGQGIYDAGLVQETLDMLMREADGQAIDEGAIQGWLDEIYQGSLLTGWEAEYAKTAAEFREAFLDSLCPFNANSELEDAFNRLFDGLEVLPAGLKGDHERLHRDRPLEAAELLVPISWRRWHVLRKAGRVLTPPEEWPSVIDVPYTEELGLERAGG